MKVLNTFFKSPFYEPERQLYKKLIFVKQNCHFSLKLPLFVEKRQNKFASDHKKNKFVFQLVRLV